MRAKIQQIVWHGKDGDPGAVYSLDFNPATGQLATCGSDREIKLWEVFSDADGAPAVRHVDTLAGHSRTVNAVRFSPGGDLLASGADAGEVFLWRPASAAAGAAPAGPTLGAPEGSVGSWKQHAALRGHTDDVQDLCWSGDGGALATGSVDNRCLLWDASRPQRPGAVLEGHSHYVQGVAWDPLGSFIATQSGDRSVRIYCRAAGAAAARAPPAAPHALLHVIAKAPAAPATPGAEAAPPPPRAPLFHDENMPSFFRRLSWSPDGSFLALPAGMEAPAAAGAKKTAGNATWLFRRGAWAAPAASIPGPACAAGKAVAVRFCPRLFRPRGGGGAAAADSPFALPYRVVFAVATLEHVAVYDSASAPPLALLAAVHYAPITDLAWAPDGGALAVSSQDGYVSIVTFQDGDLGEPMEAAELPPHIAARMQPAAVAAARARAAAAAAAQAAAPPPAPPAGAAAPPPPAAPGAPRRITPESAAAPRRITPALVTAAVPPPPPPAPAPAAAAEAEAEAEAEEGPPAKAARTEGVPEAAEPAQ